MKDIIYLDNAATTPMSEICAQKIYSRPYYNPHSLHKLGLEAKAIVEETKQNIIKVLGGDPKDTILFTGSGSEANTLAYMLWSYLVDCTVISASEHKSLYEETFGKCLFLEDFEMKPYTAYSHIHVNNETGEFYPIYMFFNPPGKRKYDSCIFHSDITQAFGKLDFSVRNLGLDMATFSAHKCHGPKGLGILWIRHQVANRLELPYLGTPPVELIAGFNEVVKRLNPAAVYDRLSILTSTFLKELDTRGTKLNSSGAVLSHSILSIQTEINGAELCMLLEEEGVIVSTGSACEQDLIKPSRILLASGLTEDEALRTVRVSFSDGNTVEEVKRAGFALNKILRGRK